MLCKLLIDNRESPFIGSISLFHTNIEHLIRDRTAESKGYQLPINPYRTTNGTNLIPQIEDTCHRTKFFREFFRIFVILLCDSPPVFFYSDTLRYHLLCKRTILIVRIALTELITMISFALKFLTRQCCQLFTGVDVIKMVAIGLYKESVREGFLQNTNHIRTNTQH